MDGRSTPSQTVGPYFSIGFAWMERSDLTEGTTGCPRLNIRGRILDGDGQPVPDAVIEIWQADARGRYALPEDAAANGGAREFWGFGRVSVDEKGEFRFTTVKPGAVRGPDGTQQAPHLEVSVFMRGLLRRLITRMYFPEEPRNETDPVLGLVPAGRRCTLVAQSVPAEPETLDWDVHLQGDQETVFFEY